MSHRPAMGGLLPGGGALSADHSLFLADEAALGLPPRIPSFGRDLFGAALGSAEPPPGQPLPRFRLGTIPRRFSQSIIQPATATAAEDGGDAPSTDASMPGRADSSVPSSTEGCAFRVSDPLLRQPLFSPVNSPTVEAPPAADLAAQQFRSLSSEQDRSGTATTSSLSVSEAPCGGSGGAAALPQGNRTAMLTFSRFMPPGLGRATHASGDGGEAGTATAADPGRASSVPTPGTNSSLPFTFAPLSLASAQASVSAQFPAPGMMGHPATGAPAPSWPSWDSGSGGGSRPGSLFPAAPMSVDPADSVDPTDPEASPGGHFKRRRLFSESACRQPPPSSRGRVEEHPPSICGEPAVTTSDIDGLGAPAGMQGMRCGAHAGCTSSGMVPEPWPAAAQHLPSEVALVAPPPAGVTRGCLAPGAAGAGDPLDDIALPPAIGRGGGGGSEGAAELYWEEAAAAAAGARDENTDPEREQQALELTSFGDGGSSASGALAMEQGAAARGGGSCVEEQQPSAFKASPRWAGISPTRPPVRCCSPHRPKELHLIN